MSTITQFISNKLITKIYQALLNYIIPHQCVICNSLKCQGVGLCELCMDLLPWLENNCQICANQLPKNLVNTLCGNCLIKLPYYDKATALFRYEKPISDLIKSLKFKQKLSYGLLLGSLLAKKLQSQPFHVKPDFIIAVPLYKTRLKYRGYNQALEIAKVLKTQLGVPILKHALLRKRSTKPQSEVLARERGKNVKNAFYCQISLVGKTILLIDDVITTGSTINEASKVLKQAGAVQVEVACLARTIEKLL